ncbi:MAG TPA: hypothetical protein VME63_18345 [Dyella sp.]|uniref:hypothetical protein n=1 Tax=Dyella sp. TaxID=1869338 RepID=UPI002C1831F5|nr:hypothetical protein [Dyella sp.]HTV87361.1 hypothetical protein [Dyella sp.]
MTIEPSMWMTLAFALVLLLAWMTWEFLIRPRQSLFKGKDLCVRISTREQLLTLESNEDVNVHSLKLGCGQFFYRRETYTETKQKWHPGTSDSVTLYDSGGGFSTGRLTKGVEGWWQTLTQEKPTGLTSVFVEEIDPVLHFHQQWATNHSLQQSKTDRNVACLRIRNRTAKAFKRWVHAHRHQLIPNEKWVRKSWDASCKRLLKECRQDILVKQLKNPLELFDYTPAPNIRYLVIGQNGQGFFKTLAGREMHAITLDQVRGENNKLTVTFPNGWKEDFSLTPEHISQLHRIRRNGEKHLTSLSSLPVKAR